MNVRGTRHWLYNLVLVGFVGWVVAASGPESAQWPSPWLVLGCVAFQLFVWQFGIGVPYVGLMSLERVPQIAVVLCFEPVVAAGMNALGSLVWPFLNRTYNQGSVAVAAQRAAHNTCMTALMTLVAGNAFAVAGGVLPLVELDWRAAFAIGAAALSMQVVNLAMMMVYFALDERDLRRVLTPFYLFGDLLFVPLGVLTALLYNRLSAPVFGLYFLQLVVLILSVHVIGRARSLLADRVEALDRATAAGEALSGAGRIDELAQQLYDQIATLYRFDLFHFATYDAERNEFEDRLLEIRGERQPRHSRPATEGVAGWVRETGEAVLIDRWSAAPAALRARTVRSPSEHGSMLAMPVLRHRQLLGLIRIQHARPDFYTEADKNTLRAIARAVAPSLADAATFERLDEYKVGLEQRVAERTAALERAAQEKQRLLDELAMKSALLEQQSREDALTQLANRRHFDERLDEELARVQRRGHALSLVLADLDHFKQVNDRFGHAVGDEVLRRVAGLVRRQCRAVDVIARYGGEELALLLPETALAGATHLAEKIRGSVREYPWSELRPGLGVTISLGVAEHQPGTSAAQLVESADARLYLAKHRGRDRVEA